MKLRSKGIRLCVAIGLALGFSVTAVPVWASVPPASQSEEVHSGEAFGISSATWLDALWNLLRAVVRDAVAGVDLDGHTLVEPEEEGEPLNSVSEPPESNTTEAGVRIDIDG